MAMAREGDLPQYLARVDSVRSVPRAAEITVAAAAVALVLAVDLRSAIGFSSFGVLAYYAVADIAAFTQTGDDHRWPRALQVACVVGCVVLAFTLPWTAAVVGTALLLVGSLARAVARRAR